MSIEAAITFFIAIFVFGITPGPGVFAILSRSIMSGTKAALPLAFGMAVSDVVYLVMACFGLATIAENWSGLFTIIRFLGAAYLFYLGWKMWMAPVEVSGLNEASSKSSSVASFSQGFLISVSNPKVILFYIAFLPTFMDITHLSQSAVILASGLTIAALMASLMLVAITAARARRHFHSEQSVKKLNQASGGIMMAAGVFLASK